MEIHTDPQNTDYKVVSGATKKTETWDPAENGTIVLKSEKEVEKLATNAFFKLESEVKDIQKAEEAKPRIANLQEMSYKQWDDPFTVSRMVRKKFRDEKKERITLEKEGQAIADKSSISLVKVLPETDEDRKAAKGIVFKNDTEDALKKVKQVQESLIFESPRNTQDLSDQVRQSLRRQVVARHAQNNGVDNLFSSSPTTLGIIRKRDKAGSLKQATSANTPSTPSAPIALVDYGSDSD